MEQGRVWVSYRGEIRRFALRENKLDVGKIAKHWKLDIETISIGPDPVEFDEQGLSTLSIDGLRHVASDDFEECGDGKEKSSPFKIQGVNLLGTNTEQSKATAAAEIVTPGRIKPSSSTWSSDAFNSSSGLALKADGKTRELIQMMQAAADNNTAMTNASVNAMQEITRNRTQNQLLEVKRKYILDTLNKLEL